MEDYLIREIDRIGELLLKLAGRLGLFLEEAPQYSISDVQKEMEKVKHSLKIDSDLDIEAILSMDQPLEYLTDSENLSDSALEAFVEIVLHTDIDPSKKSRLLEDTLRYFDGKGYYSFKLHSLESV